MLKEFFMKCKEACHKAKLLYSDWAFLCMFSNDKKKAEVEVCFSLLRKDCHILDKGLHTVPFEKGHGKAFYAEAVSLKKKIGKHSCRCRPGFPLVQRGHIYLRVRPILRDRQKEHVLPRLYRG